MFTRAHKAFGEALVVTCWSRFVKWLNFHDKDRTFLDSKNFAEQITLLFENDCDGNVKQQLQNHINVSQFRKPNLVSLLD